MHNGSTIACRNRSRRWPAALGRGEAGLQVHFWEGAREIWMRAEDHQIMQPLYVATLTRANNPDVRYEFEGTGLGWKADMRVETKNKIGRRAR